MRTSVAAAFLALSAAAIFAAPPASAQTAAPPGQTETPAQLDSATTGTGAREQTIAREQQDRRNRVDQENDSGIGGVFMNWVGLPGLAFIIFVVNYVVGMIGSTLFNLAGLVVETGLYLNTIILNSEVVQLGWRIARDLANLGFTVGIVVIAYATMLGDESYGLKKTLFNFVVAAVMVNFSFSIAGFLIDGSNLVTHFFVSKSVGITSDSPQGESHQFALALANAFGPQRLLAVNTTNPDVFESIAGGTGTAIALVTSVFFIALFTILAALGMLAVGLTLFQRFVILSGLIIVMPVAILSSSFPKTNRHWEKWKGKFLAQLFYLPVATFAIYLTLMFVTVKARAGLAAPSVTASGLADALKAVQANSLDGLLPTMAKPFQVIIDMIVTLGLLMTGIVQSSKMAGAGGKIAIDMANDVEKWAIGAAQGIPGTMARKTLSTTFGRKEESSVGGMLGSGMARIPLVRRLVPGLNRFMANSSKIIDGFKKDYESLSNDQLLATARSAEIRLNPERMAAMAKVIASKGLFHASDSSKGLTDAEFSGFVSAAKRYGADKEVLKTSPHLYKDFGMDEDALAKFMSKDFKADDMDKINSESLKDAAVVRNLTNAHMKKLDGPGKKDHRENMVATLRAMHAEDARAGTQDFKKFMDANFSQPKHIDDIHTDFLNEPFFVERLKPAHLDRMEKETNFEQGTAILNTLNDAYEDANKDPSNTSRIEALDTLANKIVNYGDKSMLWAPIADDPATKDAFEKLRAEFLKRHQTQDAIASRQSAQGAYPPGGGGPSAGRPPSPPSTATSGIYPAGGGGPSPSKGTPQPVPGGTVGGWVPITPIPSPNTPQTSAVPATAPRTAPPATPGTSVRITPTAQPATAPRVTAPAPDTGAQKIESPVPPSVAPRVTMPPQPAQTQPPVIAPHGFDAWEHAGGYAGQIPTPRTEVPGEPSTSPRAIPPSEPATSGAITPPSPPPAGSGEQAPTAPAQETKNNPLDNP